MITYDHYSLSGRSVFTFGTAVPASLGPVRSGDITGGAVPTNLGDTSPSLTTVEEGGVFHTIPLQGVVDSTCSEHTNYMVDPRRFELRISAL